MQQQLRPSLRLREIELPRKLLVFVLQNGLKASHNADPAVRDHHLNLATSRVVLKSGKARNR
ncbi:hypothetical protein D9M70_632760 [compost metagenome]